MFKRIIGSKVGCGSTEQVCEVEKKKRNSFHSLHVTTKQCINEMKQRWLPHTNRTWFSSSAALRSRRSNSLCCTDFFSNKALFSKKHKCMELVFLLTSQGSCLQSTSLAYCGQHGLRSLFLKYILIFGFNDRNISLAY